MRPTELRKEFPKCRKKTVELRGTHVVADFCKLAADAVAALQAECAKDDADVDACKIVTEIAATILTDQDQDSSAATSLSSLAASTSFVTLMTLSHIKMMDHQLDLPLDVQDPLCLS